jgi:integrase
VNVKGDDGKTRRKTLYGRTQAEAKAKLDKARRERDAGTLVMSSMTVEKWLIHWLDKIAARDLKPQTIKGYRGYISHWLIPELGKKRLTDLRPEHIRGLHDAMRDAGCAEATVRQAHAILKRSLRVAVFEGKLAVSPAERVKSPKTDRERRQQLTIAQAKRILDHTDDARWWLAVFYGMRQGEVLGLRWTDVDLDKSRLTIAQTLQLAEDGTPFFGPPKSKTSRRTMPMSPLLAARLRLHWIAEGQPADGLVFPAPGGGPRNRYADYKAWKRLLADLDLPPVALHAARNTAASLLEASGVQDRLVAQILGHSQVQITHGYQTADDERIGQAFDAAGRLLELE